MILTNGYVDYNGTNVGDYAIFTCDEGYTRTGDDNATCLPSYIWAEYNVSCIPKSKGLHSVCIMYQTVLQ